ncbi:hypothetical protein D9758_012839 [Tetrapyrgos nigripes]|uniref:Uncharacterized protein n=1 Tax=Tetrapyrgos nigripes TaxID=182062 RepID=A0A8H5FIN2_9AGAR|nr:hypothetical protein D9758_012839 [Tetrapyrgos nigripes]
MEEGTETTGPPNIVHNLGSLSIVVDNLDPDFSHWFNNLTLPHLTSLSIASAENMSPRSCQNVFTDNCFPSVLSRSGCTITSLSLTKLPLSDDDVLQLLSVLPSLSSLTIHEDDVEPFKNNMLSSHFFQSLVIDPNDTPPNTQSSESSSHTSLRHLKCLDLRLHASLPVKLVAEVIQSRCTNKPEYSTTLGVDGLHVVNILVLRSEEMVLLDVEELRDLLLRIAGTGLPFTCSSKWLE